MSIFSQATCRRCNHRYPAFLGRCPKCGTRARASSSRAAVDTEADGQHNAQGSGYGASAHHHPASGFQTITGAAIVVVVIAAVIALISLNLGKGEKAPPAPTATVPITVTTAPPTIPATVPPTQPPEITQLKITYFGKDKTEFTLHSSQPIQLKAEFYPVTANVVPVWTSDDESVCTVDQSGLVTYVGDGNTHIHVTCGTMTKDCYVVTAK